MKFEIINGRWHFGDAANLPLAIDLFFNLHRGVTPDTVRSRITKKHNYQFKTNNR